MTQAVQTTFSLEPQIGEAGMIYDSGVFHDIQSYIAQEDIPFGAFVRISGQYCELPDSSGEVTGRGGVAVIDQSKATGVGYKSGDLVAVMTTGRIWIVTEEAIATNAIPFVRFTPAAAPTRPAGGWLNTADTAKAVQPSGALMYRGSTAAGLGVVELMRTGSLT